MNYSKTVKLKSGRTINLSVCCGMNIDHLPNREAIVTLKDFDDVDIVRLTGDEATEFLNVVSPPAAKRSLTFEELRKTNLARCEESFHSMDEWSLNDWLVALGGEVGEAMNYAKKLRRLEGSKPGVRAKMSKEELLTAIKKEFGDIGTYLDLTATKLGFRLEDCIRDKFNEISDDIGSERKL